MLPAEPKAHGRTGIRRADASVSDSDRSRAVLRTIRRHSLLARGGRVVVALSGGPDSVALVHVLASSRPAGELTVAASRTSTISCAAPRRTRTRRSAGAWRTLGAAVRGRPRRRARARRASRGARSRTPRATRVTRSSRRRPIVLGADVVAVGHTRDDQAETFLLRLLRGLRLARAGGDPPAQRPRRAPAARRLARRAAGYAEAHGLAFRTDATNADVSIPRNRVRHELLPYLAREFSPGVGDALARAAAIARDDEDLSAGGSNRSGAFDRLITVTGALGGVELDATALMALHPALAARVVQHALRSGSAGRFIGFDHVERFLEFVRDGRPGSMLSLPGQRALHRGGRIVLGREPARGNDGAR